MSAKKAQSGQSRKAGPQQPEAKKEAARRKSPRRRAKAAPTETPPPAVSPAVAAVEENVDPAERFDADDALVVAGVGASAGGLEAFSELLQHLPTDTGIAFVFVQHLDPQHKSNLAEILARSTTMPVREVVEGMNLEPNQIYVIPPDRDIAMLHGKLRLMSRTEAGGRHMPIDAFFRSLAEDRGPRAIGVVLSGTGSDGALGLRALKAEGGVTFAQDQVSARYAGMPASAAAIEVDFVLSPKMIAQELGRIGRHPGTRVLGQLATGGATPRLGDEDLQKVFILLRRAAGVDFTYYKRSTVERRVTRRMVLHKIDSLSQYVRYLQQTPGEVSALFEDMLINVTNFFRDPDSFEALKTTMFPRMLRDKPADSPLRIWVPACSTGEEAYTLAILLLEHLGRDATQRPIQIFATDVSDLAVHAAREGRYPENIAADVSPERLRRYFTKVDTGYQIAKAIRDMCVVAKQNVIKDPPFSNLDMISCRNLLIYMGPVLQKKIIPTFHYALRPNGILMLGKSETIGGFAELFSLADKSHKFYIKKQAVTRLPADLGPIEVASRFDVPPRGTRAASGTASSLDREVDRLLLSRSREAGVVIDEHMNILHFRGQTGRFLEPAPGQATLNLARMAREGLSVDLRTTIHRAKTEDRPTRKEGLRVRHNGNVLEVSVEVIPFRPDGQEDQHFLVLFEEAASAPKPPAGRSSSKESKAETNRELEEALRELAETKESLHTIIEQHEAVNEELRAANEEIQSSNEELQSTNEELETAKEELQSTNEELTTLNEELENRNLELSQTLNDHNNLLASVDIPIVIVDNNQRIRLFTPMASSTLSLISADRGRAIRELNLGIQVSGLEDKIASVMEHLQVHDEELLTRDHRWHTLRIRPYKTADGRIEGAVLALIDIHDRKTAEARHADESYRHALAAGMVATAREPLVILDQQLRVISANRAFCELSDGQIGQTVGRLFYEIGGGRWARPGLRALLEEIIPENTAIEDFALEDDFPGLGRRKLVLNARRIEHEGGPRWILLAILDAIHG